MRRGAERAAEGERSRGETGERTKVGGRGRGRGPVAVNGDALRGRDRWMPYTFDDCRR